MAEEKEKEQQPGSVVQGFSALPATKQVGLLLGLAASIAIGFYVVLWAQKPEMRPLGNYEGQDVNQIIGILDSAGIDYKLDTSSGALLVAADKFHEAKIKMASEGLAQSSGVGFEMLDKKTGFGTSQFMELALYKRALEGELARSIANIQTVKSARVHLALPKQSSFVRNRKKPSASVFVDLYAGRTLEKEQVSAITHLVASSIPELTSAGVSVIDEAGRLLTAGMADQHLGLSTRQLDYVKGLEDRLTQNIINILEPIVGPGNVRAQVAADIDFTVQEQTNESYQPKKDALRSEHVIAERDGRWKVAKAVSPGAQANQAGTDNASEDISTSAKADKTPAALETKKQMTRNYELDRTISHTKKPVGVLKRLSVAAVVNKEAIEAAGEGETQIEQINDLVKQAVGFSMDRKDSFNLMVVPFAKPEAIEEIAEAPMWEQDWFWSVVKQGAAGLLILFLILGVLKPILRALANSGVSEGDNLPATKAPPAMSGPQYATQPQMLGQMPQGQFTQGQMTMGGPGQPLASTSQNPVMGILGSGYENQISMAQNIANQSPDKTAQTMRQWLEDDE